MLNAKGEEKWVIFKIPTKEQDYLNKKSIEKARMAYRIRTKMVQRVKMNFKNMNKGKLASRV